MPLIFYYVVFVMHFSVFCDNFDGYKATIQLYYDAIFLYLIDYPNINFKYMIKSEINLWKMWSCIFSLCFIWESLLKKYETNFTLKYLMAVHPILSWLLTWIKRKWNSFVFFLFLFFALKNCENKIDCIILFYYSLNCIYSVSVTLRKNTNLELPQLNLNEWMFCLTFTNTLLSF